jgi:hypothetical protein
MKIHEMKVGYEWNPACKHVKRAARNSVRETSSLRQPDGALRKRTGGGPNARRPGNGDQGPKDSRKRSPRRRLHCA